MSSNAYGAATSSCLNDGVESV